MSLVQTQINAIVTDALQFISGLKFTLNQGLPQEKLCALRQCVERILIDKPARSVVVKIKAVPANTIQEVEELERELDPADAVVSQSATWIVRVFGHYGSRMPGGFPRFCHSASFEHGRQHNSFGGTALRGIRRSARIAGPTQPVWNRARGPAGSC